jgi:phosphoserine phosphatase RsbU/P
MNRSVIVCIDDEHIILRSLQAELRNAIGSGYRIEIAESGEEALEIIEEYLSDGFNIPVVICDYIMPQMKGDEILSHIHKLTPRTHNIMLTGQSSIEGITNAINQANLYRFISKPWIPNDMAMTIRQAIRSYEQDHQIELKNKELAELNAGLEKKVEERTQALNNVNETLYKALEEVKTQHKIIENKNREITASINYAKRIQTAILPHDELLSEYLGEFFVLYMPRDIVSGDFYWCEKIEEQALYDEDPFTGNRVFKDIQNEKIIISAIDCTGHGVPGAFMSMIGNDLMNNIIIQNKIVSPEQILYNLHIGIRESLRQKSSNIFDGMDISVCVIDKEAKTLEFAGAKNPLIYIQNQELTQINGDKLGIGGHIIGNERVFQKHIIDISVPTYCYIFSDGFQDQFGGEHDRKFMISNLRKLLKEIHSLPLADQKNQLNAVILDWMGGSRQTDDILMIGFKCGG